MNSLSRLASSGTNFFLGLGDYSYSSSTTGDVWCSQFKAQYNNVEIGPGNHDTGEVTDTSGTRSYERYAAGCSYTLGSQLTCGPVTGQCYGKEYYFDYPSTSPVARFIMISPRVFNVTGVCKTTCNAVVGSLCNDTNGCWPYNTKDLHWNWTAKAIDSARTAGIRWVIVGMHKVCISAGAESCNIGTNLFNMLVSKKVDLILEGHDHTYERSKQLGFNSACTAFTTNSSYVVYNSNCVVDDGSRGFYTAGAGTVVVIGGTFGSGYSIVNDPTVHPQNAAEAPYFVSLMGSNTPGNGHGFLVYSVSAARIDIQSNFAGTYQDSFSIVSSTAPLSASFTYTPASPSVGSQVTFTGTASGGTQPYSFNWAFGDGSTGTGATATHAYATAGSYTVVLTVKDNASPQQTVTSQQTVTVTSPLPQPLSASFTFNPSSPQTNQQVTFTAAATGGTTPYSFGWTFGDGSSGTGSNVTHAYASAGTFTVVLTTRDSGSPQQTATSQQSVTVTSPPPPPLSASFTYSPSAPIAGQQVTFTASASGGTAPYSFSWNFGDGSTGTGSSISHTYVTAGTFTVVLTVKDSGSPQQTTSSQQFVTVTNPPPPPLTASFTFTPANPQVGQTVSFTGSASGGTPPYTYSWTFGDSGTGSGSSVTHTYQAAGSYTVVLTVTDAAGQTASSTQTVTVSNIPPPTLTASFTYNPSSPLVGQQVTFSASASGGTAPYTFSWAFGDGSTGAGQSITHTYSSPGAFTVTMAATDSSSPQQTASSQQSFTVTSPPPLTASFTFTPSAPQTGQQITFTASASGGTTPYSFTWTFGDGSNATGSTVTHTYTSAGTFTVVLTVKDSGSPQQTVTSQQSVTVTSPPPPPLSASFTFNPSSPDAGQAVSFTGSASGGVSPYNYSWSFGDGGTASGSSVSHTFQSNGTYTVALTINDSTGQIAKSSQTITVNARPSASISYSPSNPVILAPVAFSASVTGGTQPYSYSWDFGDGTTGSGSNVSHSYLLPGNYTVTLTVTDANGLKATASVTITVALPLV